MKYTKITLAALLGSSLTMAALADPKEPKPKVSEKEKVEAIAEHQKGSEKVSIDQDKQAANAQQLRDEQTNPKVAALLEEVELLMAEATDRLEESKTGGDTIAIQNEIIEKIYEAAKEKGN